MGYSVVTVVKALVDVALLALIAQAVLFVFAGSSREKNIVYRLFATVTRPVFATVRVVTPGFVAPQFHGLIAFFLVFWIWLALIFAKCYLCVTTVGQCQRGCFVLLALMGYAPS